MGDGVQAAGERAGAWLGDDDRALDEAIVSWPSLVPSKAACAAIILIVALAALHGL